MTKIHSTITDTDEIHVPKGFTEAGADTIPSKNVGGVLEWINKDEVSGPQGPAGPAGSLATITVVDAADPVELSTISDLDVGIEVIVRQVSTGEIDTQTLYIYDADASNYPKIAPYIMATSKGGDTAWVSGVGAYEISGPIQTLTGDRYMTSSEQHAVALSDSTGIVNGGEITINGGDNTKFDIADGIGHIVDNHTDPTNPVTAEIKWTGLIAQTDDLLLTKVNTFIGIEKGALDPTDGKYFGEIVQQEFGFSDEEQRDIINIGLTTHIGMTVIEAVTQTSRFIASPYNQLNDMAAAIGIINTSGNVYSANGANLLLNKSGGTSFSMGINYGVNKKNPNESANAASVAGSFFMNYRDGLGGFTIVPSVFNLDVGNYDDGSGSLASVANNRFSIFRLFYSQSGVTIAHYGQALYTSIAAAEAALNTEVFEKNPQLNTIPIRGWIIAKGNATDLSDSAKARFINAGKFGEGASGGATSATTTLQAAYNNSIEPEIKTNVTNGALVVQDADTPTGLPLFEVKDSAAANTLLCVDSVSVGINGVSSTAVLTVHDNGTSLNPIVNIAADDENPWALVVNNETYSGTDTHGLKFSVGDDGNSLIYAADNGTLAGELRLGVDNTNKIVVDTTSTRVETQAYALTNNLVDGANISTDCALSNVHEVILAGDRVLDNPTNLKDGSTYIFIIKQDATGTRLLTYGTAFKFVGGEVPVLSTDALSVDILTGISDGTNIYCSLGNGFA